MRVLLTGFEPFDGQLVNASWLAVQAVEAAWVPALSSGTELVTACLPVSFARAPVELRRLWVATQPDVVVCVGEAGGRARVSIERVAVNRAEAEIPDNDGVRPAGAPLFVGAPGSYRSGLPVEDCLSAVEAAGLPAALSSSAGTFVCNAVFFAARHQAEAEQRTGGGRRIPVGFVHIPRTSEQVPEGDPSLPVADSARAIRAVLSVLSATGR